jgi:NitT/TauT family transport system substrate-binding protein
MPPSLRRLTWAALAGTLAAYVASPVVVSPARAADKVAVGTGGSASDAPFYIAYDQGFFKDEGLDVDLIVLDSGAKVIAPLGTGELDVGSGALSVGFWNALLRGVKFRIVADRGHAEPGYLYQTVFMRKDLIDSGRFKSLKDLKGMSMGFAAQGVTSLSLLNEAAKFAGIKFEEIAPVYLSFPQQIAALQNKALDGTLLIEPQATVAVNAGYGVRFMDTNEFYPYQQISVIFFSDKFATERKDVADKFMRAWLRGVRAYNDAIKGGKIAGAGADAVVQTMSKSFNMKPELIREMYSQAVHVDGVVNAAGIQKDLDFFLKQGWVTGQVKASDVIDMSFAQKASAALGPYQRKSQ